MKLGFKISLLGTALVLVTVLVILGVAHWQTGCYQKTVLEQADILVHSDLDHTLQGVTHLVAAQNDLAQAEVNRNLGIADHLLADQGGVSAGGETVVWKAENQFNPNIVREVVRPKMLVGGKWLGQNTDPAVETPFVDQVRKLIGGTITVFQLMDKEGDMLRVATNVETARGTRAIGTYIPAVLLDGTPNPVISTVMKGNNYYGRAFVAGNWYIAAYQPLRGATGEIMGMLYAGIRQDQLESLQAAIRGVKIGQTGRIFVIGGSGDQRGQYIFSRDGLQDGKDAWDERDAEGGFYIREIIKKARLLKVATGEKPVEDGRYPWKDSAGGEPRWKTARIAYYAPWDWVIVAEVYEDEINTSKQILEKGENVVSLSMAGAGAVIAALAVLASVLIGRSLARPLQRLAAYANALSVGDLSQPLPVVSHGDESGEVGRSFLQMAESLKRQIQEIRAATTVLASSAGEIATSVSQVASGSTETASAVSETTATVEEVKQTSSLAAEKAQAVSDSAGRAARDAEAGRAATVAVVEGMEHIRVQMEAVADSILRLNERTQAIAEIIASVDDIAEQSNLLAVNAAIEAARAGEHGKGFGVVAQEIRNLAAQSKQATSQVRRILGDIQKATATAVMATEQGGKAVAAGDRQSAAAGESIEALARSAEASSSAAMQIAASSRQQLTGMDQVAMAMENIKQASMQNVDSMEQLKEATRNLQELGANLKKLVGQYKL